MIFRLPTFTTVFFVLMLDARAGVYKHQRSDGTLEFSNAPKGKKQWKKVPEVAREPLISAPQFEANTHSRGGSVVWTRDHADGTVEFTNLPPVGNRWKVLFRIGPGKASATRGLSDAVPPRDRSSARYSRFDEHIRDQQAYFGIPQALIRAVIRTESDYDPHVVSSAGAQGLMQLMPGTARAMGVSDVWDPRQNIMGGARYLQLLARRYCRTPTASGRERHSGAFVCSLEEIIKVVAGYHAGPGAVDKYAGLPPYETTRWYVSMVITRFEEYRRREATLSSWSAAMPITTR